MKKTALLIFMSLASFQLFAMEALTDADMQQVEGQSGADLSLKLSLNQINTSDANYVSGNTSAYQKNAYQLDTAGVCKDVQFCRLALSVNNRYVKAGDVASSTDGNKLWVVFKGLQGTINLQKLGLDGMDVIYKNKDGANVTKAAIQLSYDATLPIQIRNFGFDAISIEKDEFTSQTNPTTGVVTENSAGATADKYAYLKVSKYTAADAPNSVYDQGREKGFMGMKMNGNLALQGNALMFSCNSASNARC